jgi:hypothetical protein
VQQHQVDEQGPRQVKSLDFNVVENLWVVEINNDESEYILKIHANTGEIINQKEVMEKLTTKRIKASDFELALEAPKNVQKNKPFEVRVTLQYRGEREIVLTHGRPYFTLEIDTPKGDLLYEKVDRNDKGKEVVMQKNDTIEYKDTITLEHSVGYRLTASIYPLKADGKAIIGGLRTQEVYLKIDK